MNAIIITAQKVLTVAEKEPVGKAPRGLVDLPLMQRK